MNIFQKTVESSSLLNTITKIQSMFITNTDTKTLFRELLSNFIFHTDSEYGFIGEVFFRQSGEPYFKCRALTNISWNDETRTLYEKHASNGMEFTNLKSLFGAVMTTGKVVISNDPSNDPRRCGLPDGHPPLKAFMGIPLYNGESMVGMIGLANRPGGYTQEIIINIQPLLTTSEHIMEGYRINQQRKLTEESLRKSEKSLANAQRIARIGNWDWDIVNNGLWWSDEIYRIFGVAPQEFGATYEAFLGFVHPDDRDSVMKAVDEALQKKKPYNINHRILLSDGEIRTVHEQAEIEFCGDGKPLRMSGTVQDITEQVMIQEALKESVRQYRNLFEESKDVVFIITPEGRIVDMNPAGVTLSGCSSKKELLSMNVTEFLNTPSQWEDFKTNLKIHGFVKDFEVSVARRDGTTRTLSVTATTELSADGRITNIRGIARDMTEHKQLEQQLLHIQKMDAIGRLTGGIAHDFNNILTGIVGYANLLNMKKGMDETATAYIKNIIILTERASKLTQGLLTFSRKQTMSLKPVNLNLIIRNIEHLLSTIISRNVKLSLELSEEELTIMADSGQIEQIIMNLVTNAYDAISNDGKIIISTELIRTDDGKSSFINLQEHHGSFARLNVSDTGAGMDEDTKKRIFEPFFTTKEVGKGTGLGLSIVYGIVTSHKGVIKVDSIPGAGTTITISFPLFQMPNPRPLPA